VVRFFVYGIPVLLVALLVASFVTVASFSAERKNEITIGSIGEPTKLNPVQSQEASASDVEQFIFEALLTYDQNLEIVPQLAKSFTLSQTTTVYFRGPTAALTALSYVKAARESWAEWNLTDVRAEGTRLYLKFDQPGLTASEKIFGLFNPNSTLPLTTLRVETGGEARALLQAFRDADPDRPIERVWFDYDSAFEITVPGDGQQVHEDLKAFLAERGNEKATVAVTDTRSFLAEPLVDFQLRDGVRWHDGVPFTAKDVVFTYQAIMDETVASPRKPDFDLIQNIETPDPHRVLVTYRKPFSPALNSWMMPLLPAHILENKPAKWWDDNFNRHPIGTGPFKFGSWKTNESLRLVPNEDYYLGRPWLDGIVFRFLPDPIALRLAFLTHQTDYWLVEPWAVSGFKEDPRFTVFSYPSNSYNYIGWNLRNPLFQDLRVRTAFAHAVNVPEMIEYILYGNGVQSNGIFPPHFWFANPNIKPIPYDPAEAKRLLDEAGWVPGPDGIRVKDGKRMSFTLLANQGNEIRKDIATLVQDNLRSIGVEVKVEIYEWAVFITRFINKLEFEATVLGWVTPPDFDAFQVWHSSQTNPQQLNFVGYKNPEVDKLLENIRQEYDPERIRQMAGEIQRIIFEDQPYLFLFVSNSTTVIWKDSLRICRPDGKGGWIDTPVEATKAGWTYYMQWFYRPEFADKLPANREIRP
jgi:peptide/nickel transport system substrate-binding protein